MPTVIFSQETSLILLAAMKPDDNKLVQQIIWLLTDHRVGTNKQAIALADSLGKPYIIKQLKYHKFFSFLPNWLLSLVPLHVVNRGSIFSASKDDMPDIIISAGRRPAALAVFIKKASYKTVKLIQIMRPQLPSKYFDLLIIPHHDSFSQQGANIVRIHGALNDVFIRCNKIKKKFAATYPKLKEFVAVNIGGTMKSWQFTANEAKLMIKQMQELRLYHHKPYFITFSRRTPPEIKQMFVKIFAPNNVDIIYEPESGESNPYPGMIAAAKFILSTPDSISMLSESVATGVPIYVFAVADFKSNKHKAFINFMVEAGKLRMMPANVGDFKKYSYQPLNELAIISAKTKEIL